MDISGLNDFELGIVKGFLSAKEGKNELEVLELEPNFSAKNGIRVGYKQWYTQNVQDSAIFKLVSSYKKDSTFTNKFDLLDEVLRIKDENSSERLSIYKDENGKSFRGGR